MSAVRFPLLAALLLSACGGNPLSGADDGAGGGGSSAPVEGSVSTLSTTTTTPAASGSVERHEVKKLGTDGRALDGNGYAFQDGEIRYDAGTDTFEVDNLAFDGDNVYARANAPTPYISSEVRAFRGDTTAVDAETGATVDQFTYRALYGSSATGRGQFAIVRTGSYADYGFGGFVYKRNGGVVLPTTTSFSRYEGSYTGLRDQSGGTADGNKLTYVAGDMTIEINWDDFNATSANTGVGSGVTGFVENRRIYSLGGVDITDDILTLINEDRGLDATPISALPTLVFAVGPGVLDANGEMEGEVSSSIITSDGGSEVFDSGKYYAVLSGDDADEIVGVLVVTSDIASTTVRETGGFLLYRQ